MIGPSRIVCNSSWTLLLHGVGKRLETTQVPFTIIRKLNLTMPIVFETTVVFFSIVKYFRVDRTLTSNKYFECVLKEVARAYYTSQKLIRPKSKVNLSLHTIVTQISPMLVNSMVNNERSSQSRGNSKENISSRLYRMIRFRQLRMSSEWVFDKYFDVLWQGQVDQPILSEEECLRWNTIPR